MSSLLPQSFPRRADLWWLILACGVGGWLVIRSCWWQWSYNPQYSYGTLVPLLVLLLLARRWPDRPEQQAPSRSGKVVAVLALGGSAVLLALIQPLAISHAEWRVVPFLAATCGIALSVSTIYLIGGALWLRHFIFPILFFLVAVPWPRLMENSIMSWLMTHNTALCVEALHWLGYAAEQRGNLIAIPGALLGVEEACSGIRSLQSGIMVALAMGEFFRLKWGGRIFLFLLALGAAMIGNALRSLTLAVAACRNGAEAVDLIHDAAGLSVLLGTSALVLLAAKVLAGPIPESPSSGLAKPTVRRGNIPAIMAVLILWVVSAAGAEAWFLYHEGKGSRPTTEWTLALPKDEEEIQEEPISERTLEMLHYPTTSRSERWRDDRGWQWQVIYFHWPPGPSGAQWQPYSHDPRNCLGGLGFELVADLPNWTAEVDGIRLPFTRYLFQDRGRLIHVFHAVMENDGNPAGVDPATKDDPSGRWLRWQSLTEGKRNRGLRMLEFAVQGAPNSAEAEAAAQEWLSRRIEMQTGDE